MTLPLIPQIYGGITQLGAGAQAATAPWWLSGGVSPPDVVAAYQPKGAANLAESYINLANPGTYNASPAVSPGWSSLTGWEEQLRVKVLNKELAATCLGFGPRFL